MIQLDVFGQLSVKRRLQLMTLPSPKRRRMLALIGRKFQRDARRRMQEQRNIDGTPWEGRADGSSRKMMRKMARLSYYKATPNFTEVSFKGATGRIAREQQEGLRETITASQARSRAGEPNYDADATKKQAKALRDAGYKMRRKGTKGWRKPSLKWIQQNMKQGQAGLIIKILRDEASKNSWKIELPSRSFLGVSQNDLGQIVNMIFDNTIDARV